MRAVRRLSNRALALQVVQAWRLVLALELAAGLVPEVERLRRAVKKRAESIWQMTKQELVDLAVRELGMNLGAAQKETVIVIQNGIGKRGISGRRRRPRASHCQAVSSV